MATHRIAPALAATAVFAALALGPNVAHATEPSSSSAPRVSASTHELDVDENDREDITYTTPPPEIAPQATGPEKKAGKCKYKHGGDDPHETRQEVSGHGWWVITGGSGCSEKAKVKVKLQAWGCMDKDVCGWVTQKTGKARSIAPGQTSKRANARTACKSSKLVGWRTLVDVDLEWEPDPLGWDALGREDLNCGA